jgi:phosphoglucosamine mutase
MANLGFQRALEAAGIKVLRTAVGDRYVLEAMKRGHLDLGGEQSGHVIFKRHHATGDGLITALQVIRVMKEQGKLLTELAGFMQEVPQLLVNVKVSKRVDPESVPAVAKAIANARKALGREGRVLVRMSGTEPKVRVMVEGPTQSLIASLAQGICDAMKKSI